jgi:para-nitrobenzyl esterase
MTDNIQRATPAPIARRELLKGAGAVALAGTPLFALTPLAMAASSAEPVVKTTAGPVRGAASGGAYAFKGIPYGDTTAGANRFMPPKPPRPWTEARDATAYGARAAGLGYPPFLMREEGVDLDTSPVSEDSLMLNVWTPEPATGGKRPVMVWFHGGGYTSGSGGSVRYDGTNLAAKRDVVIVTVNHRIGALGFLHLAGVGGEKFAKSTNLGMQDIVRSLEWVRDNIANFGGDPGNVTVFGESGGGGKVSTLMGMPSARGLFHRVIAESGSAVRIATPDAATKLTQGVLEKLGVGASDLDALHALPFEKIAAATPGNIGPVADGTVIPRHPFDPDGSPVSANVPLLIGSNLTEITFFNDTPLDPVDDAKLLSLVAAYTRQEPAKVQGLIALYKKNRPDAENHLLYQYIASDWWMTSAVRTQADRKAAQGGAPVYVYQFAMRQGARGGKLNVPHTSEIAYVFDNLKLSAALVGDATPEHQALAEKMSAAWVAFARSGNPATGGLPAWQPYTASNKAVMVLDQKPRQTAAHLADELAAINALKATG